MDFDDLNKQMISWRRDLHAHPEFGTEEKRTSALVAKKLQEFGVDEVVEGIGGTGVVGTIRRGRSKRSIALRADMDALRITETGGRAYCSTFPGTMHACGHDGHTTMLLGAAKVLAEQGGFDGTVRLIFQPAEEWGKGALAMLDDGLLERFPFEEIYGLHNMPGLPVGHFETRSGPLMSAEDNFEITLRGLGGHAARPQSTCEVLVAACSTVMSLQTIVSRRLDPTDIAVVSVTQLLSDGVRNVLPGTARVLGDARSFRPEVSAEIEKQMRVIARGTAETYNVHAEVNYIREFVPLVNDARMVEEALEAARTVFDPGKVAIRTGPRTASEDFAQFLKRVPGCFAFVGNGKDSFPLHNSEYDFNDDGLMFGAKYFVALCVRRLPIR